MAQPNTFRSTDGNIVDLSQVISSASAVLGRSPQQMGNVVRGSDASEWMWVKAASATPANTLNYLLKCNTASFTVAQVTTGLPANTPVCVAYSSMDSGAFSWVQFAGRCLVIANGTISINGPLFAAASGTFTDATSTADLVVGATNFATGSGALNCYIRWPFIGRLTDA